MMGDERPVRSRESRTGDVDVAGKSCGEVRSRLSTCVAVAVSIAHAGGGVGFKVAGLDRTARGCAPVKSRVSSSGGGGLLLFRRGDVRWARVFVVFVFCFSLLEDLDEEDERDALDDIEVRGGRDCVGWAGAFSGDETVKSRVSIGSRERRSCVGVGIGASSNVLAVLCNFVGV